NRFLHPGTYRVDYLDVFGNAKFAGDIVYKPNTSFTNGVQVPDNPPNPGPWEIPETPLGIQGTVSITFGPVGGSGRPVQGATVQLMSAATGKLLESELTNGDGFYSFYYTFGVHENFIPPGKYLVRAQVYGMMQEKPATYQPITDPTAISYYVLGARAV